MPTIGRCRRLLVERHLWFSVFTNGTVRTPKQCADALEQAGLAVSGDAVLTPATSAIEILRRRGHRRVMVLGGEGVTKPRRPRRHGLPVTVVGKPSAQALRVTATHLGCPPSSSPRCVTIPNQRCPGHTRAANSQSPSTPA